jgi:hypothetical protein
LTAREVEYVSINVVEDAAGLERLSSAGMRGLPVVSRGEEFVFGVDLANVAQHVGLTYDDAPQLSGAVLVERFDLVLDAAVRFARQIPAERLGDKLPHRDRSYRTLVNHLVQIAADYLEVARGADFSDRLAASLPEVDLDIEAVGEKSVTAKRALRQWLKHAGDADLQRTVTTFFGEQTLHQVLERCVWHSAQHARQLMMVLELLGVKPNAPLGPEDLAGLPMPENVWDG